MKNATTTNILIRWSKEDTEYLLANLDEKGNHQLARELTERRKSFREVDGKKIYRVFKPKSIEKKMELLGVNRSEEAVHRLRQANGNFTSEDNVWSRGKRQAAPEGEIRIWGKERQEKHMKVNGRFVKYARWLWEQENGPIPAKHIITYIDGDPMNCALNNLRLAKRKDIMNANSGAVHLTDGMVACYITGSRKTPLTQEILKHPELIALKRQQLLLNRNIKNHERKNSNT